MKRTTPRTVLVNYSAASVSGSDEEAVEAMREFLGALTAAEFDANVFRDPASRFVIHVETVERGSAFVRYLYTRLVGRPRVTAHFEFRHGIVAIDKSVTSSVFLLERRDVGFLGSAFGGSSRAFIRANCRWMIRSVVQEFLRAVGIPPTLQAPYFAILDDQLHWSRLKWVGTGALVVGVPFVVLVAVSYPKNEGGVYVATAVVFALGSLLGGLLGWVAGALSGVIRRLRRRSIMGKK